MYRPDEDITLERPKTDQPSGGDRGEDDPDRAGLGRLQAIEQRAREVAAQGGDVGATVARYILGEPIDG